MNETDLKNAEKGILPNPNIKPTIIVLGTSKMPRITNAEGILKRLAVVRSVCITGIAAVCFLKTYKDYKKTYPSRFNSKMIELREKYRKCYKQVKEDLSKGE